MAPPSAAPSPEDLQTAVVKLRAALQILQGVAHRHKNQHRVSKWWAPFDILRRNTAKLADAALLAGQPTPKPPLARNRAKTAAPDADGPRPGRRRPRSGNLAAPAGVEARATWMRAECMPRAYLAFSQLAADNQFAPLGLLLLGVLADVHVVVRLLLGEEDGAAASPALRIPEVADKGQEAAAGMAAAEDLGVAVSRESIGLAGHVEGVDSETRGSSNQARDTAPVLRSREKAKKKRKKQGDEFDDLFSSLI